MTETDWIWIAVVILVLTCMYAIAHVPAGPHKKRAGIGLSIAFIVIFCRELFSRLT